MTSTMAGLPFWQLTFDADGDQDAGERDRFLAELGASGVTDLIVFAHGWNNDRGVATRLYERFFGVLAAQLPVTQARTIGLAGVFWPSQRWSDEPIPDFAPPAPAAGGGAASLHERETGSADPAIDAETLAGLQALFPAGADALAEMAALLGGPPNGPALARFHDLLAEFAAKTGSADDDGENADPPTVPPMLADGGPELFERYRDTLRGLGVELTDDAGGGAAGLGDALHGIWQGAKEALRQTTYWQMKNRAGTVGRTGLGPLLGRLGGVRVHLVGHSFGARVVSYSLAGLPAGPSPVRAVTLLQGAFSHFAFARPLPFAAGRNGGLAGMLERISGPLTVCFSSHDMAVGTMYPLASLAAHDDSAGADDAMFRWGGMGHDGAQGVQAALDPLRPAGPSTSYRFAAGKALNIDASEIVRAGGPPSGAHSDIVHPELTWVVLLAGGLTT
ncbi:MAG TPA: serine-threonine protein kinase [Mycobacteriales bacterium]|jgi:hypothetical protein|nr:serine-threonine protein kinase [Mycobacteriales bacterium]